MKDYLCPSGALFVSRCLIYKVHAARGDGFSSLPQLVLFVKCFFISFETFSHFHPLRPSAANSFILPHRNLFVKNFFASWATFVARVSALGAAVSKQLAYNTTSRPDCQPPFPIFPTFSSFASNLRKKARFLSVLYGCEKHKSMLPYIINISHIA